jgi:hypothetical protein
MIEKGDFGLDFLLDPALLDFVLRPLFRCYAFRGSAEVVPYGRGGNTAYFGSFPVLATEEGWRLSVDISSSFTFAEKTLLDENIKNYWRQNNFNGISPLPKPNTVIPETPAGEAPPAAPVIVYVTQPSDSVLPNQPPAAARQPVPVRNASKHVCLALGILLSAGSVTVQALSYNNVGVFTGDVGETAFRAAYPTMGLGLLLMLVGTLYNPKPVYTY